jgi:hypothetical protein
MNPPLGPKLLWLLATFGLCARGDVLDNWHWRNPLPQGNHFQGATYYNGQFVAVGDGGSVATSADGVAAWEDLYSFTNTTGVMRLLDTSATNHSRRYYRAVTP